MEDPRTEERKNFMKPQFEDPLKKREKFAVNLRKQKTSEIINAKRRRLMGNLNGDNASQAIIENEYKGVPEFENDVEKFNQALMVLCPEILNQAKNQPIEVKIQILLNKLIENLQLSNRDQLIIVTTVRRLISGSEEPPIEAILQTNILSVIATIFQFNDVNDDIKNMKMEAVWILTNLVYGESRIILSVFDPQYQILPTINLLLKNPSKAMVEQALWFLGNSIADSREIRSLILENTDIINVMCELTSVQKISRTLLKTVIWVFSNIFRNNRNLQEETILKCLKGVEQGLHLDDVDIASDTLWTLSYMADTTNDEIIIQIANDYNISRVVKFMGDQDFHLFVPALRLMGNILTSNDAGIIDKCLWHGVLDTLTPILFQSNSNIVKEACWALSNITAGTQHQIKSFIDSAAFERIVNLTHSPNIDNKKEALWVLCNSITGADFDLRTQIVEQGGDKMIAGLVSGCYLQECKLLQNVMEAIDQILYLDNYHGWKNTEKSMSYMFERNKGIDALDELQKNPNKGIFDYCQKLLSDHFEIEEDPMDQQPMPIINNGQHQFNI